MKQNVNNDARKDSPVETAILKIAKKTTDVECRKITTQNGSKKNSVILFFVSLEYCYE